MNRIIRYFVLAAMVTFLAGGPAALAKDKAGGPGERPSGWD